MPLRVAGADPGTTSLDLLVLEDGAVRDQCRFTPQQLRQDPTSPARWLQERGPFELIAGPSGYGLPLVRSADITERDIALMTLVRPDERGQDQGVVGFRTLIHELCRSVLPVIFLPGVIHLPSVPAHRKLNRIDLGTADKLCVAALALERSHGSDEPFCVIEMGSAFTALLVVADGQVVDGLGGTSGPLGWRGGGAWDGEVAYLLSPLAKQDLFAGGVENMTREVGEAGFREGLIKAVAGMQAVTPFRRLLLSGRLLEREPALIQALAIDLSPLGIVSYLESLPGAWVKHAAQGSALLADGLAGGRHKALVDRLRLREASGTVLDHLHHPKVATLRALLG